MKSAFAIVVVATVILLFGFRLGWFENEPTLRSVEPSVAAPGDVLLLRGSMLPQSNEGMIVLFNDIPVSPETVTPDGIRVRIPEEAESGKVRLALGEKLTEGKFVKILHDLPTGHPPHGMGAAHEMGNPSSASSAKAMPGMARVQRQQDPETPEGEEAGPAHQFFAPETAKMAPDFSLPDESGRKVKLSDYRGKLVALNFWASWCAPCLQEVPSLERLNQRATGLGLSILTISVDNSFQDLRKVLPDTKLPILLDPTRETAAAYGTLKFPETWVIDPKGRLIARFIGARNWDSPLFENYFRMAKNGQDPMGGSTAPADPDAKTP